MLKTPLQFKQTPMAAKSLWRPMLFLALGLHALLLCLPLPQANTKRPTPNDRGVKVTRLSDSHPSLPRVKPKPKLRVTQPAPALSNPTTAQLTPTPAAIASPTPAPTAQPVPTLSPTPAVKSQQTPESKPELDPDTQAIASRLSGLAGREVSEPVSSTLFSDPDAFFVDLASDIGKPGILGIEYVSYQRPEEVYQQLAALYSDYTLTAVGEYAGGAIYSIQKGDMTRYVNLVKAKLNAGTLLVLWKQQPTE